MNEEERKQKSRENAKRYYQKNKEKILKRQKEYVKRIYKEDENFRNKIKEKNKQYVINNPEKAREIKRKSQYKYINKKRLNGELPLTQKMLIEKLQNNWNELKDYFKKQTIDLELKREYMSADNYVDRKMFLKEVLSKMQEIEGGVDNE